jgi:hypothetical protein
VVIQLEIWWPSVPRVTRKLTDGKALSETRGRRSRQREWERGDRKRSGQTLAGRIQLIIAGLFRK